jgi:hypothetical protein
MAQQNAAIGCGRRLESSQLLCCNLSVARTLRISWAAAYGRCSACISLGAQLAPGYALLLAAGWWKNTQQMQGKRCCGVLGGWQPLLLSCFGQLLCRVSCMHACWRICLIGCAHLHAHSGSERSRLGSVGMLTYGHLLAALLAHPTCSRGPSADACHSFRVTEPTA